MNILKCAKQNPEREIKYSSLAQSVEYVTVNHGVVGSSPTGGAKREKSEIIANRRWFRIPFVFR